MQQNSHHGNLVIVYGRNVLNLLKVKILNPSYASKISQSFEPVAYAILKIYNPCYH